MADGAFEIYLAWSDRRLMVAAQVSGLQALQEAGIAVEPGCLVGSCGHCVMAYVEGDLVHKDTCLSAEDRARYFCPCVSRARTRIVLAL